MHPRYPGCNHTLKTTYGARVSPDTHVSCQGIPVCSLCIGISSVSVCPVQPLQKRIRVILRIPKLFKKPFNNNNRTHNEENSPK